MRRTITVCLIMLMVLAGCGDQDTGRSTTQTGDESATSAGDGQAATSAQDCAALGTAPDYFDSDELKDRVICTISQYTWPEGRVPDGSKLVDQFVSRLPPGSFQRGMDHNLVSGANVCVWLTYWVEARAVGDTDKVNEALDYLGGPALRFEQEKTGYPAGDSPGIVTTRKNAVENAKLGDPADLMAALRGCAPVPIKEVPDGIGG
ncbi:MAG: hypothetical protein M9953_02155 [Thermomicrobiales bacterium]|nr:hypothetical protein [Thermomicrobiales bacterium]MCO5224115.1 hypothetical protein [Thermomicrobiales bacterium]